MVVRELRSLPEQALARQVFDEIWPGEGTQITPNLLQALVHNGSYLAGVFIGDRIVGAAFAFPGVDDHGLHLHSHMAGVLPEVRDRAIGFAIKVHQRWWALEEGYATVRWTFDPLVRRNAVLNLRKLGVEVIGYHENFYGQMPDAVNAGDYSDRMMAQWSLSAPHVEQAMQAPLPAVAVQPGQIEVGLPDDIVSLRAEDPQQALDWRMRVRDQIAPRMESGWRIIGLSASSGYILSPPEVR